MGPDGSSLTILTGEGDTSLAPSPFIKRGVTDTLTALGTSPDATSSSTVNTNMLVKQRWRRSCIGVELLHKVK